jgi:hypothetical protein
MDKAELKLWLKDYQGDKEFRNSSGVKLTNALFVEYHQRTNYKVEPIYTLREFHILDTEGSIKIPSAYQIYMQCVDEYEAAMLLLGSLEHWEYLSSREWFLRGDENFNFSGLEAWRRHLELRDNSFARDVLIQKAEAGDTAAAKALISKTANKVGRPEKDTSKEKDRQDKERVLRLRALQGGKT